MTDHITACVNCSGELSDDHDAYCSDECKRENESPRTEDNRPSWYQMRRTAEVTGVAVGDQ